MKHSITQRIICLLLALVTVLGLMPLNVLHPDEHHLHAHAAETEDPDAKYDLIIDFDYALDKGKDPVSAMTQESKSNRTSEIYTLTEWLQSDAIGWHGIYDGDYTNAGGKLREKLESTDPDDKYIKLHEDVKATSGYTDYQVINITSDKVLDLNGHTIELYDMRNKIDTHGWYSESYDQSTTPSDHMSYMFMISSGATLTIIDSGGTEENPGRIIANGYMINHQVWDFWYYTHRDIFNVASGNLVIYGGEFQAGRQKDLYKNGFSWNALREVVGNAITFGTSILEYTSGIDAAETANLDLMEELFMKDQKESAEEGDAGADSGATTKKDGQNQNPTKDTKKDTPKSVGEKGDKNAQADKTVAEKQSGKNSGEQSNAQAGDQSGKNDANKDKTAKEDKWTQLAASEKAIATAKLDKDKIMGMVDSAFDLCSGVYDLIANDSATRITACIQGTVAKVGQGSTLVIYGGKFIGHGSTPNVRNAVIEVEKSGIQKNDKESAHYGKYIGGNVYVYGGTFEAYTGANIFNMVKTNRNQTMTSFVRDKDGNVTTQTVTLGQSETCNMEVLQFEDLDSWLEEYEAATDAKKKEMAAPDSVSTANVVVRNGLFRCFYEVTNMAVLQDANEGKLCPKHEGVYDDDCDDYDYRKFTGTPGCVNLGVESFDEDMIRDGRIQIVDVYGQGELVLLDGGDPIEDSTSGRDEGYTTEGGFRHYRLFVGDRELRASSYLHVYPNDAQANSSFSFNLRTYWGTGSSQSELWDSDTVKEEKEWPADAENIRAPYSSNEKFFEFVYDDTEDNGDGISANYYVVPNLKNTNPRGSNLNNSNVWYYNVPVDQSADENPIGDFVTSTVRTVTGSDGSVKYYYYEDASYRTNIKWFTYKVYRVDPLSRENINESENVDDNEPLIEVCYGASNDSLKCKLPLLYLEEQIKARTGGAWTGYKSGEMYRIVFSVEEHLGYGYQGLSGGQAKYDSDMPVATAESSILFRCVSKDEKKESEYYNPSTGTTNLRYEPDFTALQFDTDTLIAGETAEVKLVNGQTGLVDWVGDKIFDIYYQWWLVDEDGNDIRMLAGTDNVWVAQDSVGKDSHRPTNFIINKDGQGVNGEMYYNTVDPDDPNAAKYGANGLPTDSAKWTNEMLHMYTKETSGENLGLRVDPSKPLDMGNNNALWGNTDTCYIPSELVGQYIQVRLIAVNCKYPTYYDNKQTIKSHVIQVEGPTLPKFDTVNPTVTEAQMEAGTTNLGIISEKPTFSFTYTDLAAKYYKSGYKVKPTINVTKDGGEPVTVAITKPICEEGWTPGALGKYEVELRLALLDPNGEELDARSMTYSFTLAAPGPKFTTMKPAPTAQELAAGITDLGALDKPIEFGFTYEYDMPEWMQEAGYYVEAAIVSYKNGVYAGTVTNVSSWTPSGMGDREVVFRVDVLNPMMEVVATTSHIYRFSLGGEGLAAFVDYENKTVDHGEVANPGTYTLSFDYSRMPQWMIDGGYRLYGQMVVTHNGEVVATFKYNGDSYTPTLCGDYEISYKLTLKDGSELVETINEIHTFTVPVAEAGKVYFHDGGITKLPVDQKLMGVGETYQILYDVEPIFAKDSLVWTSSNTSVATVDQNGLVAACATGTATITASNADGSISDSMVIQVTAPSCIIVGGVGLQPGQYLEQGSGTATTTKPADNYAYVYIDDLDQMCLVLHNYTYTGTGSFFEKYDQTGIQTTDEDGYPICIYLEGENCIDMSPAAHASGYNWANALTVVGETYIFGVDGGSLTLINAGYAFVGKNAVVEIYDAVINTENVTYDFYDKGMDLYFLDSTLNLQAKHGTNINNSINFERCEVDITAKNGGIDLSSAVLKAYDSNIRITSIEGNGIYGTGASEIYIYSGNMHVDGKNSGIWLYSGGKLYVAGNLLATSARTAADKGANTDANSCALKMKASVLEYDTALYAYGSTECDGSNGGAYVDASMADYDFVFIGSNPYVFDVNVYTDANCTTKWDGTTALKNYSDVRITHKHTLEHFEEIPAGCETTGVCEYWYCTGCRKLYAEEACTTEITNTTVAALGHDWMWNTCTEPRHCQRCDLIDEMYPATGHSWSAATCQTPMTCFNCRTTMGGPVDHNWQDATCDMGEYCSYCYIERTDPLGHDLTGEIEFPYGAPTCSSGAEGQQYCSRCEGYVGFMADPDPDAHRWIGADCENPAFCEDCGIFSSEDPSHTWIEGDCETPTTCSVCGETKGTVSSHSWKAATCSYARYCRVCGKTDGEPLAHTWITATCSEPKTCSVCYATEGDPLPHNLRAATCTAGETCSVCGWVETEPLGHSYTDDVCTVCGARDPSAVVVPTLTGKSFSLSFEDEILVNFYYAVANGDDILEQGMLVFYTDPGSADITKADDVYSDFAYDSVNNLYANTTDGIAAKYMGDNRYYCAYAKLYDGTYAYSKLYQYSPKKYSTNLLAKASTSAKQKALCVAMLNYGAAAQEFFGYKTNDLMNAGLTAEQKALNVAYDATLFTGTVPVDTSKTANFTKTATGFSARSASVSFEGAFSINYYFTASAAVDGEMMLYYWTPADYAAAATLTAENASGSSAMVASGSTYWGQVSGIAAKSLDETYYVAGVYTDAGGNTYCTGVIAYSLSKYCMNNAKPGKEMQALASATAMYGYYAKQYFTT